MAVGPLQNLDLVGNEPLMGCSGGMLGIIVLLEDDPPRVHPITLHCLQQLLTKDVRVGLYIPPPIDPARVPDSLGCYAPSHHQTPTTELDRPLDIPCC